MNKDAAINLVKTTFENPYSRERFLTFVKNLFHFFEPKTFVYRGKYIPNAYKAHIKTFKRIGKYEDQDDNKIDILAVCLKKQSSLERARTMQRNFIAWYLNSSRGGVAKDAALVAFYTKDSNDWRLSLVKMDYSLGKSKAGKIKAITELTPARLFSFSVGKDENTHTAQKQLLPILQIDDHPPKLSDLENAFSVEVVTKDFFEKYKTLFLNTKEALDKIVAKDAKVKSDFTEKNIDTVDFTKKLLGQIVFLYFLQKKGWFGIPLDKNWGDGPKDFLRRLFDKEYCKYDNFFDEILEPLFYESLAKSHDDDYQRWLNCRIPFLNGGLFDPICNYDWVNTKILLSNELFSNSTKTKEGDIGDGILDVFDRYNFTVKEDEPLEREVAVDPEMLGKVFENLLEVTDRKSKGTYYTPREIVHYMCQESLVNYLTTETDDKIKRDDIETLIRIGEIVVEHDSRVVAHGKETEAYKFKLPQSVRKNASLIDESLEKIKVCDPAVGSGAFLVGMMIEVIRARNILSSYINDDSRSMYDFKRHAIQNCLYGVDIDPGAVEIAKLRLWLSLIVDEQDIKQIKPLPNLDYKIMQGNSLLEEYEGIKLFDEGIVSTSPFGNTKQIEEVKEKLNELQQEFFKLHSAGELKGSKKQQIELELSKQNDLLKKLTKTKPITSENGTLFDQLSQAKQKADELKELHQVFFEAAHKKEKDRLKQEIEALEWDLIETTLREQNKLSLLPEIERFKKANIKPFFLWKLNFSEVFEMNGGFDVVIGNPPYVRVQSIDPDEKDAFRRLYHSAVGNYDIYVLFVELGWRLLSPRGFLGFIQPNKFMRSHYGKGLRKLLSQNNAVAKIIDFGSIQIFGSATNYTCLLFLSKRGSDQCEYVKVDRFTSWVTEGIEESGYIDSRMFSEDEWNFIVGKGSDLFYRLEGLPIKLDDVASIFVGIQTSADDIFIMELLEEDKETLRLKSRALEKEWVFEKELLLPVVSGTDVLPYGDLPKRQYILFPYTTTQEKAELVDFEFIRNKYPKTADYLLKNKKDLQEREGGKFRGNHWYRFGRSQNIGIQRKVKVCIPRLVENLYAAYDSQGDYVLDNVDVNGLRLKPEYDYLDLRYLLGLLNSKLVGWHFLSVSVPFRGGWLSANRQFLSQLPMSPVIGDALLENSNYVSMLGIVSNVLAITHSEDYLDNSENQSQVKEYQAQIDILVYKLYGLTPEEIEIVEGKNEK